MANRLLWIRLLKGNDLKVIVDHTMSGSVTVNVLPC